MSNQNLTRNLKSKCRFPPKHRINRQVVDDLIPCHSDMGNCKQYRRLYNIYRETKKLGPTAELERGPLLGEGSYGSVYKIQNKEMALKTFKSGRIRAFPDDMVNETGALRALVAKPSIVDLLSIERSGIYLPLFKSSLNNVIAKNIEDLRWLTFQLCHGLYLSQNRGIFHLDIKPGNILYDPGPTNLVEIADFGLSQFITEPLLDDYPSYDSYIYGIKYKTNEPFEKGLIASTLWYRSPETTRGMIDGRTPENFDIRKVDVWSIGMTIMELTRGRPLLPVYDSRTLKYYQDTRFRNPTIITYLADSANRYGPVKFGDDKEFIDLMVNMLQFDSVNRYTFYDALSHPFLAKYRDKVIEKPFTLLKRLKTLDYFCINSDVLLQKLPIVGINNVIRTEVETLTTMCKYFRYSFDVFALAVLYLYMRLSWSPSIVHYSKIRIITVCCLYLASQAQGLVPNYPMNLSDKYNKYWLKFLEGEGYTKSDMVNELHNTLSILDGQFYHPTHFNYLNAYWNHYKIPREIIDNTTSKYLTYKHDLYLLCLCYSNIYIMSYPTIRIARTIIYTTYTILGHEPPFGSDIIQHEVYEWLIATLSAQFIPGQKTFKNYIRNIKYA